MKFRKFTLLTILVAFVIGLLITVQWKTPPTRVSNPVVSYMALKDTADELISKQEILKDRIAQLQKENKELQMKLKNYRGASKEEVEGLEKLKETVGLTEIKSKGIIIVLDDSQKSEANPNSIAHAADMRDIVNFLWINDAQAVSINGQRITAASSIDCIVNTVLINETKTTAPFIISVIGSQDQLYNKLTDKRSLAEIYYRVEKEGLVFEIKKSKSIFVPAYNGSFNLKFAKVKE